MKVEEPILTAANTATDGTGTVALVATAPSVVAPAGAMVEKLRCTHLGTNVATVVRVFLNNGLTPTDPDNNALIAEKTMPANTISRRGEPAFQDIILNQVLKGHATTPERLYATIGTPVADGIRITVVGRKLV